MKYNIENIGRIILSERKRLDMTQEELGVELGISGKQISNYEKGKLLPPTDLLLKMADIFNCELGYFLGEESYKDRTKLNTAICEYLGLTDSAVEAFRVATHDGLTRDLAKRQQYLSRFFESPLLSEFLDRLVDAADARERSDTFSASKDQRLIERYGEKAAADAIRFYPLVDNAADDLPDEYRDDEQLCEAIKSFDAYIDEEQDLEYALKIARYELRETFERLVRNIV